MKLGMIMPFEAITLQQFLMSYLK